MNKKISFPHFIIILCLSILLLLVACGEPAPLTQEGLDNLNCHPGDLPKKQTYEAVEGRAPSLDIFFEDQPILVSTLAWNDIASTRQTLSCTMFTFADEQLATQGFQRACDQLRPPFRFPDIADQACQSGGQEINLIFRKGTYLVWLWVDYKGQGIEHLTDQIIDRLDQ